MKVIEGRTFRGVHLNESVSGPLTLLRCGTRGCSLGSRTRDPADRVVVKAITARDCTVHSATVGPVLFEDMEIEGLQTGGDLRLSACAFRRCVFRGRIGSIIAYETADFLEPLANPVNRRFYEDNCRIYGSTDWALDISDAEFEGLDLRAVPAELVRINGKYQIKVAYEAALSALNDGVLSGAPDHPRDLLQAELEQRRETRRNLVLVTSPGDPEMAGMLEFFGILRSSGLTLE